MMLKLSVLLALVHAAVSSAISEAPHPNIVIMHVNNLEWSDLGIHHNKPDNENATPNIDRLAYGGVILNHFYANGGARSLYSGCYRRSPYGNPNLMTTYFERNGYRVSSISISNHTTVGEFYRRVVAAISSDNEPLFVSVDFGNLGSDIKLPYIDEIVGGVVAKAHQAGVLDNTIILFLSLPAAAVSDNELESSPIESHYRRTAFVYGPRLLSLSQSVANQLVHISDVLPTLVSAAALKWRTRDRIYIDGVSQWPALNANGDARTSVFGDNFYIEGSWKLSYGTKSDVLYDSVKSNRDMEMSESDSYDVEGYIESITGADIDALLPALTPARVVLTRNRAKVHCNLRDIDGGSVSFVINVKCSRASPCLFDLQSDPCELDDRHEREYDTRRAQMRATFEDYLTHGLRSLAGEAETTTAEGEHGVTSDPILTPSGGFGAFLTLMITLFVFIFMLVFIACIKERCNSRRSVYVDKSKKVTFKDESGATFGNGVSTISSQVQTKQQTRL